MRPGDSGGLLPSHNGLSVSLSCYFTPLRVHSCFTFVPAAAAVLRRLRGWSARLLNLDDSTRRHKDRDVDISGVWSCLCLDCLEGQLALQSCGQLDLPSYRPMIIQYCTACIWQTETVQSVA